MNSQGPENGHVYVLVVHDFLIREDLAATLRDVDPLAVVVACPDFCDALAQVRQLDQVTLAIIEAGPASLVASGIEAAVADYFIRKTGRAPEGFRPAHSTCTACGGSCGGGAAVQAQEEEEEKFVSEDHRVAE